LSVLPDRKAAPQAWLDDLSVARADRAAGRVLDIDLDALCREIEAEAAGIEDCQRQDAQSRA
jgi:hypothetical protein